MSFGSFVKLILGGFWFILATFLVDQIFDWPWLAEELENNRAQALTVSFFSGAILSSIATMRNSG